MNQYELSLPHKQKVILSVLMDSYSTGAYTKELYDECDECKDYTLPQITFALEELRKSGLTTKSKGIYKNKVYTYYKVSDYVAFGGITIK